MSKTIKLTKKDIRRLIREELANVKMALEAKKQTDDPGDITFEVSDYAAHGAVEVVAKHPRLGKIGYLEAVELDMSDWNTYGDDIYGEDDWPPSWDWKPWNQYWKDWKSLGPNRPARAFGVTNAFMDKIFRITGAGTRMYEIMLSYLANSKEPAVLMPNRAFDGEGSTSHLAWNVWKKLKQNPQIISKNNVLWGKNLPLPGDFPPLRPRRHRGWLSRKRRQYRERY